MSRMIRTTLLICLMLAPLADAADIFTAIKNDDITSLVFILNNIGPEKASEAKEHKVTPLHLAAALNRADHIGVLISFGADIDARTDNGFTPLHWAASKDAVKALRALTRVGADPDVMTNTGITPLHWAASKNATNAVSYLLSLKSNIHAETASGMSPLHWAVKGEADDAAHLLAYVEVSEQLENDDVETASFEPDASDSTPTDDTVSVPTARMTPTVHKGHSFKIPLGASKELSFIWLESLKLWFGKFEITNGQFRRFKHTHTSMFVESVTLDGDDQPVVFVTWNEAKEFCNWLNRNYSKNIPENWVFRLPTGREWGFAAQCDTDRKYPWGDDWPPLYGNYSDLSAKKTFSAWKGIDNYNDNFPATCPVIYSGTNEWGICGLGGNVWEWCEDWYGRDQRSKILHGGGWDFDAQPSLTIDYKGFERPNMKYDTVGFRVVISKRQSSK